MKSGLKIFLALFFVFGQYTCIEPYFPRLSGDALFMVVDGLITNENRSYIIKLSHTKLEKDSATEMISDATVFISDETGENIFLRSCGNGVYKTDSISFRGEIGKTYQLHIKTSNGTEYESDSCRMFPVAEIDTIYFDKDVNLENNQTVLKQGISIYLVSKPGITDKYFLRWDYEETWKFKVPEPKKYNYINDTTILPVPLSEVKEFCWKRSKSAEITTGGIYSGESDYARKEHIKFIASGESDRLTIQYSILIKQYSISQKEFNFWNNLKEVTETEGDIFGSQPFAVLSNVKNKNNPSESVIGYFQVSAASEKRIYITSNEITPMDLPRYNYACTKFALSPSDLGRSPVTGIPYTWNDIYEMYSTVPGIVFVAPLFDFNSGKLLKLIFSSFDCADCELTGTINKPDFWKDN